MSLQEPRAESERVSGFLGERYFVCSSVVEYIVGGIQAGFVRCAPHTRKAFMS